MSSGLRQLQRILYPCKIMDNSMFPVMKEDRYDYMEKRFNEDPLRRPVCFSYYRMLEGQHMLELHIWDMLLPDNNRKFVLYEGCSLPLYEEEMLLSYLNRSIRIDGRGLEHTMYEVRKRLPNLNLKMYSDPRHILLHLYFTLHRSGPLELLFKANLNYLAADLDQVEGYNMLGTSPSSIYDVPLGMLKALNTKESCEILRTEKNRRLATALYTKYHNEINGRLLNKYQWNYLEEQYYANGKVNRKELAYRGLLMDDRQYSMYARYLEAKKVAEPDYYKNLPQHPEVGEGLERVTEACEKILWCIEHEEILNKRLEEKALRYRQHYAFEDEDYFVHVPSSVKELLKEAENQHNCVYSYIVPMAVEENENIVFVRRKDCPNQSLITVEIEDGGISQAYCANNRPLSPEQREVLERFAAACDLYLDYEENYDEDDEAM